MMIQTDKLWSKDPEAKGNFRWSQREDWKMMEQYYQKERKRKTHGRVTRKKRRKKGNTKEESLKEKKDRDRQKKCIPKNLPNRKIRRKTLWSRDPESREISKTGERVRERR